MSDQRVLELTADIVSAHVANNRVASADVPALIRSVFGALSVSSEPLREEAPRADPAVSIRASIRPDYLVCLEDGARMKMLKRYLRTRFDMSPDEYRAKWGLPRDYPMVAPNYAETRRTLAKDIGLGHRRGAARQDLPEIEGSETKPRGIAAAKAAAQAHLGTAEPEPTES